MNSCTFIANDSVSAITALGKMHGDLYVLFFQKTNEVTLRLNRRKPEVDATIRKAIQAENTKQVYVVLRTSREYGTIFARITVGYLELVDPIHS